jgi:hypothetical protein
MTEALRALLNALFFFALLGAAHANPKLAPGFQQLDKGTKLVLMPVDAELYSLSAGGVAEPRADWTASALHHMTAALRNRAQKLGVDIHPMSEAEADEHSEPLSLHATVADAIVLHHAKDGAWPLPSKNGQLDWSLGNALRDIGRIHSARYGLFVWVRDSYASAQRKAAMVAIALVAKIPISAGTQVGYASLVDLETGQVLWFNQLTRSSGDLREANAAAESVESLLFSLPGAK